MVFLLLLSSGITRSVNKAIKRRDVEGRSASASETFGYSRATAPVPSITGELIRLYKMF
jgi:hypothetical protein